MNVLEKTVSSTTNKSLINDVTFNNSTFNSDYGPRKYLFYAG